MPIIFSTIAPARPACQPPARIYFEAPDDALLARVTEKVAERMGRHLSYTFHDEAPGGVTPIILEDVGPSAQPVETTVVNYPRAAPPTAQAQGWQSIDTAPKEGVFLVFMQDEVRPARRMQVANWHPNVKLVGGLFAFDCAKVTHWMPLPNPPTSAEGVEHE